MHNTAYNLTSAPHRDRGAAGFLFWIVLYAAFLVALMALGGGSRVLTVHHMAAPVPVAVYWV